MGQTGNTDFLNTTTGSVVLITDTYVDKHTSRDDDNNSGDTLVPMINTGDANETAYIASIQIPKRDEVLDSNDNKIPEDAILTGIGLKFYATVAPSGSTTWYAYFLADEVNIEAVTHNHIDGLSAATAWDPDFSSATHGNSIYKMRAIFPENSAASTGYTPVFEIMNMKEIGIDWGSKFQIIVYTALDLTFGTASNATAGYQPVFQLTFEKPTPASPKIKVVPDEGGINGIIEITPSSDKAIVKHSLAWSTANTTIPTHSGHNPLDIDDIGRTEIQTSEFANGGAPFDSITVFAAGGGSGVDYNYVSPLAFDSGKSIDNGGTATGDIPYATRFQLFAEDNYNTNANGGASNIVTIARPAITLTDSASGAIEIGDENTFTLTTSKDGTTGAGLGNYEGAFTEYAFHPSIDDIAYDTGLTTSGALSASAADEFEAFSSDKSFEVGDLLKIDDEYIRVVGFQNASNTVAFERGALGSTIASHSSGASIYKVDDTELMFTELSKPTSLHTFKYKYPSPKNTHTAVAYVKDQDGWRSDPAHIAVNVNEADPIVRLSASRTKVPYAQYGDSAAGLTLSLSNSRAIGSDRELTHYLYSYKVGKGTNSSTEPQPIACSNGLTNDNSGFDSGSKRVAIVNCGANEDHSDAKFKIFGVASFQADGSVVTDTNTSLFSHYGYATETLTVNAARLTETLSTNYYKSIDCIVGVDISANDAECTRYILKIANADVETNFVAEINGSGLASDATVTTVTVDTPDANRYSIGDYIKIDNEIMLVTAIPHPTQLTVIRGMMFSVAATHADDADVLVINHNIMVNRDLRIAGNDVEVPTTSDGEYWKWGGFARIVGSSAGDGIDFDTDETIELQTVLDANSTGATELDWYVHGFLEGDIIKVGNTTNNGTYISPKYFKIIKIYNSGGGVAITDAKDIIKIADTTDLLTDDEVLYMTTSIGTQNTDTAADIVRYDNALTPTRTVTLNSVTSSSDVYAGEADDFIFAGGVIDSDNSGTDATAAGAPWIYRDSYTSLVVRGVSPRALDLDSMASSGDIAILDANITRTGGATAAMVLGDRRYPVGGFSAKLGDVAMSLNIRMLSQTGFQKIWSLIEGDTYDFAFIDSKKVDSPDTAYKSYKLKLTSGSIKKSPEHASQYLASLKCIVLGEEIS